MTIPDPGLQPCGRCRTPLRPEDVRRVPNLLRLGMIFSLGAVHAGMWIAHELAQPFCPRCRKIMTVLSTLLLITVATLELLALNWLFFTWRPGFKP